VVDIWIATLRDYIVTVTVLITYISWISSKFAAFLLSG